MYSSLTTAQGEGEQAGDAGRMHAFVVRVRQRAPQVDVWFVPPFKIEGALCINGRIHAHLHETTEHPLTTAAAV